MKPWHQASATRRIHRTQAFVTPRFHQPPTHREYRATCRRDQRGWRERAWLRSLAPFCPAERWPRCVEPNRMHPGSVRSFPGSCRLFLRLRPAGVGQDGRFPVGLTRCPRRVHRPPALGGIENLLRRRAESFWEAECGPTPDAPGVALAAPTGRSQTGDARTAPPVCEFSPGTASSRQAQALVGSGP